MLLAISIAIILIGAGLLGVLENKETPLEWVNNAVANHPAVPFGPLDLSSLITTAASFFGLATGALWLWRRGGFSAAGAIVAARSSFCDWIAWSTGVVAGAGRSLPARCRCDQLYIAFCALRPGGHVDHGRCAMVIYQTCAWRSKARGIMRKLIFLWVILLIACSPELEPS